MTKKVQIEDSEEVADKNYQPSKKEGDTETEKALSETNKQIQNLYYKGTVDREKSDDKT